jgi:hypothetical protein
MQFAQAWLVRKLRESADLAATCSFEFEAVADG